MCSTSTVTISTRFWPASTVWLSPATQDPSRLTEAMISNVGVAVRSPTLASALAGTVTVIVSGAVMSYTACASRVIVTTVSLVRTTQAIAVYNGLTSQDEARAGEILDVPVEFLLTLADAAALDVVLPEDFN